MNITGWGNYPIIQSDGYAFETTEQLSKYLEKPGKSIPFGMGRSYGDSALNSRVLFTGRFNKIINFDSANGIVTCESGVTLIDLIDTYMPKGWFLSITPGTKFITVGGAVASDVHGKNHHKAGCFSECVLSFTLMLPDGKIVVCSREENTEFFYATCGGMGLTGIILTVTLKLIRIKSNVIRETVIRCQNLKSVFELFENYKSTTYSVAWIDCLAKGDHIGRSVFMAGEHDNSGGLKPPAVNPSFSMPFNLPGFCLNRYSVSIFNHLFYQNKPEHEENRMTSLESFFYPLDAIGMWNRLYGKGGFTQYQLVFPKETSFEGLKIILGKVASAGLGSFLAVLKLFGPQNDNYLSFPMEGYTLAIDLKIQPKLFSILSVLDRIVLDYGGRIYLTKDVRMQKETFRRSYPKWEKFVQIREHGKMTEKFSSLQSKRLGI